MSVIITKNEAHGTLVQEETINASATRNITTFEVLDNDAQGGDYALIYKSIAISHSQVNAISRANTPYDGGVYSQYLYSNGDFPASALVLGTTSDVLTSTGTRTVTYKLHYKIAGQVFRKDLATAIITNNVSQYTVTGNRLYGVSIQVFKGKNGQFIVYSYEKHSSTFSGPLGAGTGYPHDSPRNIEDWNVTQSNQDIWTRDKHVIGLININDKAGSTMGYLKEQEYDILSPQLYAVGVVNTG